MKILIAFEESGVVRDAFIRAGFDAESCDIQPSRSDLGKHHQCSVFDLDLSQYGCVIAHPPCTALAVSGNRWYAGTKDRNDAVALVESVWNFPVDHLAIENPVGVLSTQSRIGKPYYIQPYEFGHGETKKTGIWSRGLPRLHPTNIVEGREQRVWKMGPSPTRQRDRSATYCGIADAMASQWGNFLRG